MNPFLRIAQVVHLARHASTTRPLIGEWVYRAAGVDIPVVENVVRDGGDVAVGTG